MTACNCTGTGYSGTFCTIPVPYTTQQAASGNAASTSLVAVWVVLGLFVAFILIIAVYVKRRQRKATFGAVSPLTMVHDKKNGMDWQGIDDSDESAPQSSGLSVYGGTHEPIPIQSNEKPPVNLQAIIDSLKDKIESNEYKQGVYISEFENLPKKKINASFNASTHGDNASKNRYRDILPYDDTRVQLTGDNNYINANHVCLKINKQQFWYIATQGPTGSTTSDFWRMVWESQARIICMVTRESEKGVSKCSTYWPTGDGEDSAITLGKIRVTLVRTVANASYIIRGMHAVDTETNEKRFIWQLQYVAWPDHGVPSSPDDFLAYLDELHNIRYRVCAGNTGEFYCICWLLNKSHNLYSCAPHDYALQRGCRPHGCGDSC